ncbi:DUF4386 domain-containing protein [Nesterenkonia ebinurensis]|uniref:DUF4386 domain-containing protein n=1 Tax=Nesterenkonia ebinurensis TaxID=2608252 RepID=UPI00123DA222|nr:DUF4386 domain-containing protein [Nesterenkonia ebinurensis]
MSSDVRIARRAGAAYLALALFGVVGFLVIRPRLHSEDDPAATYINLVEQAWLGNLGIAFELLIVIAQAAAALGFYALSRSERPVAAYAVAAFGMANALTILGSAAFLILASQVAADPGLAPDNDAAAAVALAFSAADAFWAVGSIFFGLWLMPMGWFMVSTRRMPPVLGWILMAGGIGYVLNALLSAAAPGLPAPLLDMLTIPATIGEFWTIGYMLTKGIRAPRAA